MNPIDIEKPIIKEGEFLCDGCWLVSKDQISWAYFNFKHVQPVWLCAKCHIKNGRDLEKKQRAGV